MNVMKHWLTNIALFQCTWFSALFLENKALPLMIILAFCMFHFGPNRRQNLLLILCGLPIAIAIESMSVYLNWTEFKSETIPLWLIALWVSLLLTVNLSLKKFTEFKYWQQFIIYMVSAPPSYMAGAKFGVLSINLSPLYFWFYYGLIWSLGFILIVKINDILGTSVNKFANQQKISRRDV